MRSRTDSPAVLPEHDAVVFDEAHRLEESAATWLGGRISGPVIHRLLRDIDRACREAAVPVPARAVDRVEGSALRLLQAVAPESGRRRLREIPAEPAGSLQARLGELAATLTGKHDEVDAVAVRALRLTGDVGACLEADDANRVVWAEPDLLAWAPVDVCGALTELLWEGGARLSVLVSATLPSAASSGSSASGSAWSRRTSSRSARPTTSRAGAALPAAAPARPARRRPARACGGRSAGSPPGARSS